MIDRLLVATRNRGKVREIIPFLKDSVKEVICLLDLDEEIEVEETEDTFEGNAVLKSEALFRHTGLITLADDSGIEVDVLDGAPGVYSARFSGEGATDKKNSEKLLRLMEGKESRSARFRCVMALTTTEGTHTFDGKVDGIITEKPAGTSGFGYDPVFIPDGYTQTFAELGLDIKQTLSHRAKALEKTVEFIFNNC